MEDQKMDTVEKQVTLTSSAKKFYQAPQLIQQGTWTAKTGTILSEALGNDGVGGVVCGAGGAIGGDSPSCNN